MTFNDLMFSSEGKAGAYQLRFECLSFFADSKVIDVKSSVATISYFSEPLSYMNLLEYSLENKLTPIVKVLDINGQGVYGKTVEIELWQVDSSGSKHRLE